MARKHSRETARRVRRLPAASRRSRRRPRALHPRQSTAAAGAALDVLAKARTIVYVHGIGNKPIPSILKCQWDDALFGFGLGERSRLAYWVNRTFYPEPIEATCKTGDVVALDEDDTAGPGAVAIRELEITTLQDEVAALTSAPGEQAALLRIAREVQDNAARVTAADIEARSIEARVLPLPPFLRRWITRKLTRAFLRDVHEYFFVPEARERMRASVLERLRVGGGPFVVIGHSQGSMIAYDVLHSLAANAADVRLLVTIGSPLGLTEVKDQMKILTRQRTLAVPACVRRWLNVADPLDPVAADKRLTTEYTPRGFIVDDLEWNPDSPRHPHSGTGYLRTDPVQTGVRGEVDTALFQPVATFVIARDVSRDLENSGPRARHPVLIQLVDPDAPGAAPLDDTRRKVIDRVRSLSKKAGADEGAVKLESLRRFVAARLTREETETLASELTLGGLAIKRIWRNAEKHALIEISAQTVQARPAHLGYQALGRNIAWAVLDSGIAADHPHFKPHQNIGPQFDCTKTGPLAPGGKAPDGHGHGTHVAGVIAGYYEVKPAGASNRIFSGMAPEAKLHVYKVLDDSGKGEDAWIIKALDHIAEINEQAGRLQVHGVNLSLGGGFDPSVYGCGHSPLCNELRRLWQQGVAVVIAAGNQGFVVLQSLEGTIDANLDVSISDPANLEEAIAVGSVHKENPHTYGVSYFSSRGPTADGRQKPDLVAPGERILSCRHRFPSGATAPGELYVEMSGTSMAAPHVSGVLAGYLSVRRELIGYPDRVKQALVENCTDIRRDRPHQGAGIPNLERMLLNS